MCSGPGFCRSASKNHWGPKSPHDVTLIMKTKADFVHDCLQLQLPEKITGLVLSRLNYTFHHRHIDVTAPGWNAQEIMNSTKQVVSAQCSDWTNMMWRCHNGTRKGVLMLLQIQCRISHSFICHFIYIFD